jgi:hypothetical protein
MAVTFLSLLFTTAFGSHTPGHCDPGDDFPTTGYGYGYGVGYGYGYGYGPCPSPVPTASPTASPSASPTPTGPTITLKDSDGNVTTQFEIAESGNTAELANFAPSTAYNVDFAQSPGVVIGSGTTNSSGAAAITFNIPTTADIGNATLTFLPPGATTGESRAISIVAAQASSPIPTANATATAVPVGTSAPTSVPSLPDTGARISTFLVTAFALAALGAVLQLIARSRRNGVLGEAYGATTRRTTSQDLTLGLGPTRFGRR